MRFLCCLQIGVWFKECILLLILHTNNLPRSTLSCCASCETMGSLSSRNPHWTCRNGFLPHQSLLRKWEKEETSRRLCELHISFLFCIFPLGKGLDYFLVISASSLLHFEFLFLVDCCSLAFPSHRFYPPLLQMLLRVVIYDVRYVHRPCAVNCCKEKIWFVLFQNTLVHLSEGKKGITKFQLVVSLVCSCPILRVGFRETNDNRRDASQRETSYSLFYSYKYPLPVEEKPLEERIKNANYNNKNNKNTNYNHTAWKEIDMTTSEPLFSNKSESEERALRRQERNKNK